MQIISETAKIKVAESNWIEAVELVRLLQEEGVQVAVAPSLESLRFITRDAWKSLGCSICDDGEGVLELVGDSAGRDAERVMTSMHVSDMQGRRVLVTAGPTIEDIDCARFLSNRSSGRMGVAIAQAAARRGAIVALVHGPLKTVVPENEGIFARPVRNAMNMRAAVMELIAECDVAIFAAAVADFAPASPCSGKIKKESSSKSLRVDLRRTPDILSEAGNLADSPFIVGFAAEADNLEANAEQKMKYKNCDIICANSIAVPGRGFEDTDNELLIIHRDGRKTNVPLQKKLGCAHRIIDEILSRT